MDAPNGDGNGRPAVFPNRFLSRVRISTYRSIETCDVALGPLTVLVGRNGSGKGNSLDAPSFVVDSLQVTWEDFFDFDLWISYPKWNRRLEPTKAKSNYAYMYPGCDWRCTLASLLPPCSEIGPNNAVPPNK